MPGLQQAVARRGDTNFWLCNTTPDIITIRDAIIKENPVKSGFLQIPFTPQNFWNAYFLADPDFKIYPPPLISGSNGFLKVKYIYFL